MKGFGIEHKIDITELKKFLQSIPNIKKINEWNHFSDIKIPLGKVHTRGYLSEKYLFTFFTFYKLNGIWKIVINDENYSLDQWQDKLGNLNNEDFNESEKGYRNILLKISGQISDVQFTFKVRNEINNFYIPNNQQVCSLF